MNDKSKLQLTKNQHFVPDFYLKLWEAEDTNKFVCHNIEDGSSYYYSSSKKALRKRYFYEEDISTPDNRVEDILSKMEGTCSVHLKSLNQLDINSAGFNKKEQCRRLVQNALTTEACKAIKIFAAYQYLRVPGAIDQKRYELSIDQLIQLRLDYLLNAGRFVESGFSYIKERFLSLKMIIAMSTEQDFITSDWPCFDTKYSNDSPVLGEEIGINPDVVVYLPLTLRLGAILYPSNHIPQSGSHEAPEVFVQAFSGANVRNLNSMVIQQAERFVIANKYKDFIFKVAKKRKKNQSSWPGP